MYTGVKHTQCNQYSKRSKFIFVLLMVAIYPM